MIRRDKGDKIMNREKDGKKMYAQRHELGSFNGNCDDKQTGAARHGKGGEESERGRNDVSGRGVKVRRRQRGDSSKSESMSDTESDVSKERGRNGGNSRKGDRNGERRKRQTKRKRGDVRESRRGSRSETDSDATSLSCSDSETDHAGKKRKGEESRSVRKEKGRANGCDKKLVDRYSEDSEDGALHRRKRRERSRDQNRGRKAGTKDRSSKDKRKRRRESESESESSSDRSDDRRERKRRKRRKQEEREERKKRKRKDKKEKRDRDGGGEAAEVEGEETGTQLEKPGPNSRQEAARRAAEEAKRAMRQNAEVARARLAGEVEQARAQQAALQNQFGAVDQRAVKKMNAEKRKLKSMLKASHKLEALEAKEAARMDAFRVAMGLPTAEAQRQAEWRAEATQQAAFLQATSAQEPLTPRRTLGPQLPGSKPKATH